MKQAHHVVRVLLPCVAFVLSWLSGQPASAQDLPPQAIDERLRALMVEHGTLGLAVVVVRDNAIAYRDSLGWKRVALVIPFRTSAWPGTGPRILMTDGRMKTSDH